MKYVRYKKHYEDDIVFCGCSFRGHGNSCNNDDSDINEITFALNLQAYNITLSALLSLLAFLQVELATTHRPSIEGAYCSACQT